MGEEVEREDGGCTRKRGRVESKGGTRTSTIATVSRLVLPGFTFVFGSLPSPHPGQGQRPDQIIHIPLRPLISRSLIVSAHTAPSVIPHSIWSAPFATGLFPLPVISSSSVLHRIASIPASEHSGAPHTGTCAMPKTGVMSHFRRCKAQSTSTFIVPDLLFLLYRRIYIANALLSSRPEHSPCCIL